jgi:hypothetical protein
MRHLGLLGSLRPLVFRAFAGLETRVCLRCLATSVLPPSLGVQEISNSNSNRLGTIGIIAVVDKVLQSLQVGLRKI